MTITSSTLEQSGIFNVPEFIETSRQTISETIANLAILDEHQSVGNIPPRELIRQLKELDDFIKSIKKQ